MCGDIELSQLGGRKCYCHLEGRGHAVKHPPVYRAAPQRTVSQSQVSPVLRARKSGLKAEGPLESLKQGNEVVCIKEGWIAGLSDRSELPGLAILSRQFTHC